MLTVEQEARLKELQSKGAARNKAEKTEYEELSKLKQEAAANYKPEKMVEVNEKQLSNLIQELKNLKAEVTALQSKDLQEATKDGWQEIDIDTGPKKARLRVIDSAAGPGVVVDWKFKGAQPQKGGPILFYEYIIRMPNGEEMAVDLTYDEFVLQEQFIQVDIVSMNMTTKSRQFGTTKQKLLENFKMITTNTDVPLLVTRNEGTALVRHPEYGEFEIDINKLNT